MNSTELDKSAQAGAALAVVALLFGAVAMAASALFVRWAAAEGIGPFASAFWRVALALPFLWAWAALESRDPVRPFTGSLTPAMLLAGFAFAGDLFFWHLAILGTTVANATFLATTSPVWVLVGTWLVLRRKIARSSVAGLAVCLAGGGLLLGQSYGFAPERLMGDVYGIITGMFFAAYLLAMAEARAKGQGAARVTLVSTAVTAAVLFVVASALETRILPTTAAGWAILGGMALVAQVAGQGLMAFSLGRLPAIFSSLVIFFEAVAAAILGWLFLAEAVTLVQAIGGCAILIGIWIARPRPSAARPGNVTP